MLFPRKIKGTSAERPKTLCPKAPLVGELVLFFEIAEEWLLMVEHPAGTGVGTADLQTSLEVVRVQSSLYGQEAEGIGLRHVERNSASIEANERMHRFGNGTEQCFLGEVRNDGVVDIEEAAFQLLTLPQRLFRLFPLRDIDEGDDGADGSTLPKYRMGPKLHRKAGAVLSPINLVVSMNALAVLKTYINGALLDRIGPAVWPRVVFQRMHVLPQQFGRIVISKQAHRRRITEKASTVGIATKDPLRGGIEYEPDSLLALLQRLFRLFSLRDVFRERHDKSGHVLGARNQRNVVAHPDQAAILASILLLDLKLLPLSFQQLGDERPVGFAVVRMGDIEKRKRPEFLLAVAQHFLVDRIGGQEAAVEVGQRNTDGGILKDRPPTLFAPRDLQVCLTQSFFVSLMFRDVA